MGDSLSVLHRLFKAYVTFANTGDVLHRCVHFASLPCGLATTYPSIVLMKAFPEGKPIAKAMLRSIEQRSRLGQSVGYRAQFRLLLTGEGIPFVPSDEEWDAFMEGVRDEQVRQSLRRGA